LVVVAVVERRDDDCVINVSDDFNDHSGCSWERDSSYSTNRSVAGDYRKAFWLHGELSLVIRGRGRRIMSEDVTDQSLLDVSGLSIGEPLDESALARALKRIMTSSAEGPSNSFQASI
jgi:hypothetical protein